MKKILLLFLVFSLTNCYVPNSNINPTKFHFYVQGNLENVEDYFFESNLKFSEIDYTKDWSMFPNFNLILEQNDTIITYQIRLNDCENYFSLINYNEKVRNCNETFIGIKNYNGNYDSIPNSKAKEIFKIKFIDKLKKGLKNKTVKYHLNIEEKSEDSIIVNIFDENLKIRKKRIYTNDGIDKKSADSLSKLFNQTKIIDYRKSSTVIYEFNKEQEYMYIENKKTMPNTVYSK